MYLQETAGILESQFVKIKYDCDGDFDRCGKEWLLKLKDAKKNFLQNLERHVCRQCQLRSKNPMSRKEVQEKVKKTTLRKYGVSCAMNTHENIDTRNERMFGSQEAIDARTKKTKETNLIRYGVEHAAQSTEKKEKTHRTNRERYGTNHPMQNAEVAKQALQTVRDRYKVDNVMQVLEVQQRQVETTLGRHGVEHYNQLPEMKDYLRNHCTTWLAESYNGGVKPQPEGAACRYSDRQGLPCGCKPPN